MIRWYDYFEIPVWHHVAGRGWQEVAVAFRRHRIFRFVEIQRSLSAGAAYSHWSRVR